MDGWSQIKQKKKKQLPAIDSLNTVHHLLTFSPSFKSSCVIEDCYIIVIEFSSEIFYLSDDVLLYVLQKYSWPKLIIPTFSDNNYTDVFLFIQ